jgi:hypothetical protein
LGKTLYRTDLECSWMGTTNSVKMVTLLKATDRFCEISIKIPMAFLTKIEKPILNSLKSTKDHEYPL